MKLLRHAVLVLFVSSASTSLFAQSTIPDTSDKAAWRRLGEQFAECSAIYNIVATQKENPEQGTSSYRELANNALIAGMHSTEHAGLGEADLEKFYSVKFELWQKTIKNKSQQSKLFAAADQCFKETLALQNQLVSAIHDHSAK